jgi:hypothetical protein
VFPRVGFTKASPNQNMIRSARVYFAKALEIDSKDGVAAEFIEIVSPTAKPITCVQRVLTVKIDHPDKQVDTDDDNDNDNDNDELHSEDGLEDRQERLRELYTDRKQVDDHGETDDEGPMSNKDSEGPDEDDTDLGSGAETASTRSIRSEKSSSGDEVPQRQSR